MTTFPPYTELVARTDAPSGSSWGLFGTEDQIGTLNHAGAEQVLAAAASVRTGEVITLDYPLDAFNPPLAPTRGTPVHHSFSRHPDHRDDVIEKLFPQASTHLDGLRHRRHHEHGFYNHTPDEAVTDQTPELGIQYWSERGIVARGLMLDMSRARDAMGNPIDHAGGEHLTVQDMEAALDGQDYGPRRGDILLIHTGWSAWYLKSPASQQRKVRESRTFTGLDQDPGVIEWLWDRQFSAVVSDTYALEALPARHDSPYGRGGDAGMMHQDLIALLGLAIGELWRLGPLAAACSRDQRSTCMVVAKPLNLRAGVGSPANATAIL